MEAKYYKDIIHDCICIDADPGIQIHDDILVFSGQVGKLHRISTDLKNYDAVLTANTRHSPNTVSMLGQRRRRWPTLNALCLPGGVTALRPTARAVQHSGQTRTC